MNKSVVLLSAFQLSLSVCVFFSHFKISLFAEDFSEHGVSLIDLIESQKNTYRDESKYYQEGRAEIASLTVLDVSNYIAYSSGVIQIKGWKSGVFTNSRCEFVLIAANLLATAGHCAEGFSSVPAPIIDIYLGAYEERDEFDDRYAEYKATEFIQSKLFNDEGDPNFLINVKSDIAVIKISELKSGLPIEPIRIEKSMPVSQRPYNQAGVGFQVIRNMGGEKFISTFVCFIAKSDLSSTKSSNFNAACESGTSFSDFGNSGSALISRGQDGRLYFRGTMRTSAGGITRFGNALGVRLVGGNKYSEKELKLKKEFNEIFDSSSY